MDKTIKNNRILVVDDEHKNVKLLQVRLKSVGYDVSTAMDGEEGFNVAQSVKPSIIVSDLMMPNVDGIEFLKRIRNDDNLKDTGFILLTARDTHESTVEGLAVGADDYIAKPFDTEELLARIKTNVRVSNLQEEIKDKNQLLEDKINELVEKDKLIQKDLETAKSLQQSLLPANFPENSGVKFGLKHQLSDKVGGDIYNFFEIDKHSIGVLIADVSGQGVPAAFISTIAMMAIVNNERYYFSPALLLQAINEEVCGSVKMEYYLNMFYFVLDTKSKRILFSKNSHNNTFLYKNKKVEQLSTDSIKIGCDNAMRFEEEEMKISSGDKILVCTNGVSNCIAEKNAQGLNETVKEIMEKSSGLPVQGMVDSLFQETITCTKSGCAGEDITIIGIEIE